MVNKPNAFAVWDSRLYNLRLLNMSAKILSHDELMNERAGLRAAGKTLVFTNGVFDILHVGHVRYLAEAGALGDALVVAINSDRSVCELNGMVRPLMIDNDSAEFIATF